jgi:hypothetical protein
MREDGADKLGPVRSRTNCKKKFKFRIPVAWDGLRGYSSRSVRGESQRPILTTESINPAPAEARMSPLKR